MQADERVWDLLAGLDPQDVGSRSLAEYSASDEIYTVRFFGRPIVVDLRRRTVRGADADSDLILKKLAYFSQLTILHYLIRAQAIPLAERLVRPLDLQGGHALFRGAHTLPLRELAERYARDSEGFVRQAMRFGGSRQAYGDVAVEIVALPRLPVTFILWLADDEFAARADLLFDATCERHVPADVLWSIATLAAKVMMLG